MRNVSRTTIYHITIGALCALLFACGGMSADITPNALQAVQEAPDDTVAIEFSIASDTGFLGSTLSKDASAGVRITGDDAGIFAIDDRAAADCNFRFEELSVDGYVDIIDGNDTEQKCDSPNRCLTCYADQQRGTCSLSCSGFIPSSTAVANDGMNVEWTMRADFRTDMPNVRAGAIRIDAFVDDWPEMAPNSNNTRIFHDLSRCDGTAGRMSADETDPLLIAESTETTYRQSFAMEDAGDGNCQIGTTMQSYISFRDVDTQANLDPNERHSPVIHANAKICDDGYSKETCKSDLYIDQPRVAQREVEGSTVTDNARSTGEEQTTDETRTTFSYELSR